MEALTTSLSTEAPATDAAPDATAPRRVGPAYGVWRRTLHHHFWLLVCSALYVLASWYTVAHTPAAQFDTSHNWRIWYSYSSPLMLGLILGLFVNVVVIHHPRRPLLWLWRDVRFMFTWPQLATGLLTLFLFAPVAHYCMQLKSLLPYINPINHDLALSQIDLWLGGGHYPHEYLSFLTSASWRYKTLSAFYGAAWICMTLSVFAYTAFVSVEGFRKSRFLLAYSLCWMLLGSVAAIALNSGGPMFFHDYTGLTTYDGFVQHLRAMSGDTAWTAYAVAQTLGGDLPAGLPAPPGRGISAMPSLHVATAFLVVLHAWRAGRLQRLLASLYCVAIYIGSIALGWHYAIDGIASVVLTLGVWWLADQLTRSQPRVIARLSQYRLFRTARAAGARPS